MARSLQTTVQTSFCGAVSDTCLPGWALASSSTLTLGLTIYTVTTLSLSVYVWHITERAHDSARHVCVLSQRTDDATAAHIEDTGAMDGLAWLLLGVGILTIVVIAIVAMWSRNNGGNNVRCRSRAGTLSCKDYTQ